MDGIARAAAATRVVAHRGYHAAGAAENSLGAFRAAVDLGADVLELDVRRTRDGILVVHHDPGVVGGRKIADLDHAQLPALADGQRIPRLSEVADLARQSGSRLTAELKEAGYEREAVAELASRLPREQLELISFNRGSVRTIEQLDPSIRTGLLEPRLPEWLRSSPLYPAAVWLMERLDWHPSLSAAARVGADYVSVEQRMARPSFLRAARERGIPVDVWTVDDPARMRELFDAGVQGVVTDRPDLALQLRPRVDAKVTAAAAA